jgi:hypothetical protein
MQRRLNLAARLSAMTDENKRRALPAWCQNNGSLLRAVDEV